MSIVLLPFRIVWGLLALILNIGGRLLAIILGLVLLLIGALLTLTGVGALFGVPMLILGFALILRGLF
ncbi:MAG: hypothetical protein K8L99_08865 [Anaerolineae bacterium]|nr:hypothetical protein [Anaerolineae bacterium]